jgi:hypothetical protein
MGYINIKITDIQIPNDFVVYYKEDDGSSKPYPINGNSWIDYGSLVSVSTPIFAGGTATIMLSGSTITNPDLPDFQYGTTYWIKLQEYQYPDRYVIKNIRIFDAIAYEGAVPVTPSVSASQQVSVTPSITRTATPSRPPVTPTTTPSVTTSRTPTRSLTPTTGLSPSVTPSTSSPSIISQVYFASLSSETATMGINNPAGRTFSITFSYHLNANCNNEWSGGQNSNQATTYLFVSINNGSSWTEVDNVISSVNGGTFPVSSSDPQDKYGTYVISGITDVTQVKVLGQYECEWTQDSKGGIVDVTIASVSANTGIATIICNDSYRVECLESPSLYCVGVTPTPTPTPTMTPTITRTPSQTPAIREVLIWNNAGYFINITNVWIGGDPIYNVSPEFPLFPGDNAIGLSPRGNGTWDVVVYIDNDAVGTRMMTIIDGAGYEHCRNINQGDTQVSFTGIQITGAGWPDPYEIYGNMAMIIELHTSGICPSPPPQTPSITPTVTRTPSVSGTPGRTPTRTPSASPTIFGYNISVYSCNDVVCGVFLGNSTIESSDYLNVGSWYKYNNLTVYYISGTAPLGGNVVDILGPAYNNCTDACGSYI